MLVNFVDLVFFYWLFEKIYLIVVSGEGVNFIIVDGCKILDGSSGVVVLCFGYGN